MWRYSRWSDGNGRWIGASGHGTPHLHFNFHLASVYQYGTMQDVVDAFEEKRFQYEDWKRFYEWYCAEEVLHADAKEADVRRLEEDWSDRFRQPEHKDMCVTPLYLTKDAECNGDGEKTTPDVGDSVFGAARTALEEDGAFFKDAHLAHAQSIFDRVQHHWHKLTKQSYVPLKTVSA